MSKSDSLHQ